MDNKQVTIESFDLHYLEKGSGDVLVLLPSLGITSKSYQQFGKKLAEKYRVIIPNLASAESKDGEHVASIEEYASFLDNFLKKIKIDNFHLLGFSFGGLIASEYYRRYPSKLKSIFLTSTTLIPIKGRGQIKLLLNGYPCLILKNFMSKKGIRLNFLWLSDGFSDFIKHPKQYLKNGLLGLANLNKEIEKLNIPNLLILANRDEFIPVKTISQMRDIKGLNMKTVSGGHAWFFANPNKFFSEITRFLEN